MTKESERITVIKDLKDIRCLTVSATGHLVGVPGDKLESYAKAQDEIKRLIEKTCCFTGHRPQFCVHSEAEIKGLLREKIDQAIEDGYTTFITGMACGVDIWAAEIIIDLMKDDDQLKLICAVPFKGMENRFSPEWQERYRNVLDHASDIRYICPRHNSWCYKARNQWMVDYSTRVIAVYNGKSGGTKQTIEYAKDRGKEVVLIDERQVIYDKDN